MDRDTIKEHVEEAVSYVGERTDTHPEVAIILGSGQSRVAEGVTKEQAFSYDEIPHFPVSLATGHPGKLITGTWQGRAVVVMQGRIHYYEGYTMTGVTFPVRVLASLGAESIIITNAAGGINPKFSQGDLMLIRDHINFMGQNPLIGLNDSELGPSFLDMSEAYSKKLLKIVKQVAKEESIKVHQGVYAAVSGPNYETPAETKFLLSAGADAVGMSTVPEVIVANQVGMEALGISCIANAAASSREKIAHDKVLEVAEEASVSLSKLIRKSISKI